MTKPHIPRHANGEPVYARDHDREFDRLKGSEDAPTWVNREASKREVAERQSSAAYRHAQYRSTPHPETGLYPDEYT